MERIVAAAIMDEHGLIYTRPRPARHHDCYFPSCEQQPIICGFLTSDGRFVDRRIGRQIAVAAEQILPNALPHHHPILCSEDLW